MKRIIFYIGNCFRGGINFSHPRYSRIHNFSADIVAKPSAATVTVINNPVDTLPKSEQPDKDEPKKIDENLSGTQVSFKEKKADNKNENKDSSILNTKTSYAANQKKTDRDNKQMQSQADTASDHNDNKRARGWKLANGLVRLTASGSRGY